ncbi:MAG TPA: helix-turn-helix domain-containing protein [Gaiellaceae bacterium]|nr:helix-turn-helix domain-containing protein [Gaiellaceae bacterium]
MTDHPLPEEMQRQELPADRQAGGRERLLHTAYGLFRDHGFTAVGVDRIADEAGVAKTTLYHHFASKDELGVAVLGQHQQLWTHDWLAAEADRRKTPSVPAIIGLFDALDEWYRSDDYRGCLFINTVLELRDRTGPVREAAVDAMDDVHATLEGLAEEAGIADASTFAHQIQLLMRGSIVAAVEGHFEAVAQARVVARMLLEQHERESS